MHAQPESTLPDSSEIPDRLKVLYIGESWLGSCARSLRESLARCADVVLDDLAEDAAFPPPVSKLWLRAVTRLTESAYRREFNAAVMRRVKELEPDVVMVYKGYAVRSDLLAAIRQAGAYTVNVYPDCSPHAQGQHLREALGHYDLVISTKVQHPDLWHTLYGYDNRCLFVAQGYDSALHLVMTPPRQSRYDVVLVGTCREEYGQLMVEFSRSLDDPRVSVAIGGPGWDSWRSRLPSHWTYLGPVTGGRYVAALRQGKICVAPLTRRVVIDGQRQPGDVDTTRSYELAAAWCFFIHRRTDFVKTIYDEETEVPMFDDGAELAAQVKHYLADDEARARMAAAAHARAVPAYSVDARAQEIVNLLRDELPRMHRRESP